ncbi:MAG: endonuclease III [Eubacteriales bacterium]|nr:endonuclease III [Eubacteriales bacterium]MDD3196931.1 endonuclease III [Eubacteriales bacterium]MDD3502677.1 endonuclease III [Eubacteriales bacterium]MDD4681739.1 endonuclease III [Eubacteriales bacterium]
MTDQNRASEIARILKKKYPDAECTLNFKYPWQLMIAAILAAQCTDARVNIITADLFEKYPDLEAFASASQSDMEEDIRSCGLFRNKAKAIIASSSMLLERYAGEVPSDMDALLRLPGIGRKIANLIMGDSFGVPAVVVDTHCARITRLLGLTSHSDPVRIERDLMAILPKEIWTSWGHLMVAHGREICKARQPVCEECPVNKLCLYALGVKTDLRGAGDA